MQYFGLAALGIVCVACASCSHHPPPGTDIPPGKVVAPPLVVLAPEPLTVDITHGCNEASVQPDEKALVMLECEVNREDVLAHKVVVVTSRQDWNRLRADKGGAQ